MIQIYKRREQYEGAPNTLYAKVTSSFKGIYYKFARLADSMEITLSGTCEAATGNRLLFPLMTRGTTYEECGGSIKIILSTPSDRNSVYFGISYKAPDEPAAQYKTFADGETEREFIFPAGTTEINLGCYIDSQKTVDQTFTAQLLFPTVVDYEFNGDAVLLPYSCVVRAVLNGAWELEIEHRIDEEGRWKYIENGAVIKVPSFMSEQLFRVKQSNKTDSGVVATAEPIFMDAMDDCFLVDVRPTEKTGQEALDIMMASSAKYSGQSDITRISTAYYQTKNLIEAINGDEDNSFINRWGGEILFDNYNIVINDRIGSDSGVQVLYGKNIKRDGVQESIDDRDVVTRIVPKSFNGYMLDGNEPWVDSPIIGQYPVAHTRVIVYEDVKLAEDASEDDEENGIIICDTLEELRQILIHKCEQEFEDGIDKPQITLSIDMVLLQNTQEYADYQLLESVALGDTVHCRHNKLGIDSNARVIELEYDCIMKKVTYVKLGDFTYNYFDSVSSVVDRIEGAIRPDGSLMAEKISGVLDAINTQLRYQKNVAQRQDVRAILFEDLDPASPLYGALAIGTQGFQIADPKTLDGKEWDWRTAFTAKGGYADVMTLGILADKAGKNFWNLLTGELSLEGSIKTRKADGSYTSMDADGLMNVSGTTKEAYHYMTATGIVTMTDFNKNTYSAIREIQLPTKFKGKKISFVPYMRSLVLAGESLGDQYWGALSKLTFGTVIDEANAKVTLTVECRALYLEHESDDILYPTEYGTPNSLGVQYIAIA